MTDGLLLIDKPAGPTSHDVVAAVRRIIGIKRIGHAGTLDPGASGLLVILAGRATRLARFIGVLPKRYQGTVRFGSETTTDDAEGETTQRDESWRALTEVRVAAALADVAARRMQVPPPISAKKVAGERAYRRARRGEVPDLKPVPVTIFDLRLSTFDPSTGVAGLEVACSAGTYVRAIARDVGRALGTRAHLAALRRLGVGPWSVEDALPLDGLGTGAVSAAMRPMGEAVAHLPALEVGAEAAELVRHGRRLEADGLPASARGAELAASDSPIAVFRAGELLAIAELRGGVYAPAVVFVS